MSIWRRLPLSDLELQMQNLTRQYGELASANGDHTEAMALVATTMKEIGMVIIDKRLQALTSCPDVLPKLSARLPKRESDCRAFKKYGSCKRGNRCWWKHDPQYKVKKKISVANQEDASEVMLSSQ